MKTEQIDFWKGEFGEEYTSRNTRSQDEWDQFHLDTWGLTKIEMYEQFIGQLPKTIRILEVGSNTGMQLAGLQRMGFENLFGVELQPNAVELAKKYTRGINLIEGSGFDLPFKDGYFDLVFTSGVLIHISPEHHAEFMGEMMRCSSKYILGFEYYSENIENINYRGNEGFLWKADFSAIFQSNFSKLKEVDKRLYPYKNDNNTDAMYLLENS